MDDDGEIGKVTISDNEILKRKRKKKGGGIEGKEGIIDKDEKGFHLETRLATRDGG